MRGSAIERSQNRQRKLDGIIRWYFDSVMESLPLMLQVALLLLGCALSRYLWKISSTIASVVLGVTSFGLLFYLFILIAGTIWESCPYQTPGSTFFRYLGPTARRIFQTTPSPFRASEVIRTIKKNIWRYRPFSSRGRTTLFFSDLVRHIPSALAADVRRLGWAVIQPLYVPLTMAYRSIRGTSSTPRQILDHQPTVLDFRCTSWALRTSLERPVHLSTLKYLVAITDNANFDSTVAIDCFNVFVGYVRVSGGRMVFMRGLEELATVSARCLLQAFHHLSATHPTSSVLADLLRCYERAFPAEIDFRGLLFCHTMTNIHALVNRRWSPRNIWWHNYRTSNQELIPFARHMVDAAHAEYQQNNRVPRWILRFALHFLSLDPPPPTSVLADCLTIIVIALDHDLSSFPISDDWYAFSGLLAPIVLIEI